MDKTPVDVIEQCIAAIEAGDSARALIPLIIAEAKARAMEEFARSHIGSQNWVADVAYVRADEYRKGTRKGFERA